MTALWESDVGSFVARCAILKNNYSVWQHCLVIFGCSPRKGVSDLMDAWETCCDSHVKNVQCSSLKFYRNNYQIPWA